MEIRKIQFGSPEYDAALALRRAVMRTPLGLDWTPEELSTEAANFHLGAFEGERLLGVLMLRPVSPERIKMRQVAVDPTLQGQGVGKALVAFAEEFARQRGYEMIVANARVSALPFYERLGYEPSGKEFIEVTVAHRRISKTL